MTTTTNETEIKQLGVDYHRLAEKYERTMRNYIGTFKPLDSDEEFWTLLAKLQQDLRYRQLKDSKHGCEEFVRSLCFTRSHAWPECQGMTEEQRRETELAGWTLAARFLASYRKLYNKVYKALDNMPGLELGDDSFGDLCDSLPLAGKAVIDGLFNDDIANSKQLNKAVPEEWQRFCLRGENYVRMNIETALIEKYAHIVRRMARSEEDDE